jgi:predicted phosphodiesterase
MVRRSKVIAIPDLHLPWADWKRVEKAYQIIQEEKPDIIIQLGDLKDRFTFSRFARSHDIMTPKEEVQEARAGAVNFWAHINKLVPKAKKIQLTGNHEARLLKSTLEKFPEIYSIVQKAEQEMFKFAGVKTIYDSRAELEIEGVIYCHGYLTKIGDHAKHLLKPVVHGHSHRGGVVFFNLGGKTIWELDCGYLADPLQVPLMYGPTKTTNWTHGIGIVDKYGPRFVSL